MLTERLFSQGVMAMGPSRLDPNRQVGVFPAGSMERLSGARDLEMDKFRWIAGEWSYENRVPATRASPAYTDIGGQTFSLCEEDTWVCIVAPGRGHHRNIAFDPFSQRWIYVLTRGSYGVLRSRQGWTGDRIVFSGLLTMIGIDCEWRMTWTKTGPDEFGFVNEEQTPDGSWAYVDEWRFRRK